MKVYMAAGVSWRHAEADPMVDVRRCMYCHTLLPLEPAKDTAETEVEIIAVEIALMTDEEREAKLPCYQQLAFAEGFEDTYLDEAAKEFAESPRAVAEMTYNAGERAAWLAAQIIQHEVEGDPK